MMFDRLLKEIEVTLTDEQKVFTSGMNVKIKDLELCLPINDADFNVVRDSYGTIVSICDFTDKLITDESIAMWKAKAPKVLLKPGRYIALQYHEGSMICTYVSNIEKPNIDFRTADMTGHYNPILESYYFKVFEAECELSRKDFEAFIEEHLKNFEPELEKTYNFQIGRIVLTDVPGYDVRRIRESFIRLYEHTNSNWPSKKDE